jgi:L-serine dehydratase
MLGGSRSVGYLCKHNATLAGAEGGCPGGESASAVAMGAAFSHRRTTSRRRSSANGPESSLEHTSA